MRNRLITGVEADHLRKAALQFDIGDEVEVKVRIREGGKERIQPFIGQVIARRGGSIGETFTVRRIVNNEGVERVFPVHSPHVVEVVVRRSGEKRRAKLYFLRQRIGKARKLRERRTGAGDEATSAGSEKAESGAALAAV